MQGTQVRSEVGWHLKGKHEMTLPLARDSLTLVLNLLEELLRNTFCRGSEAHATTTGTAAQKTKHKLDPETVQQRWQALFPYYPELTCLDRRVEQWGHLIEELVAAVRTVLWEGGLAGPEEEVVGKVVYCARASLAVATRIGIVATSEIRNTQPKARSVPPRAIRKAILNDPSLGPVFKDSHFLWVEPQSLAAQCATVVVEHEVPYHDLNLPDEVVEAIEKKDKAATMRRLLGRIDAILALKLDPVTDKEIWAVEKKFQIDFPPEVRAFLKWNDGVPRDAPGMSKFVKCASLAEIYEAFFYKFGFARLMRWMEWIPIAPLNYEFSYYALDIESGVVVRINNYNHLVASLVALSFVDGVRAYVDALERHKDNLEALQSFKPPEEVNHLGELCIEANDIFARFEPAIRNPESLFAYPSVFDGSEGEEDDYCNSSRDEDEDSDDEDSDDDEEIEYDGELRLNMGRLKRHKLTELRRFVKKHNIEVFGRMKDDLVDAITSWKQRQEEEQEQEDEDEEELRQH